MAVVTDRYAAAERFVSWLGDTVVQNATASRQSMIAGKPSDRFWLGRVAPAQIAAGSAADPRLERLEPCQIGFRFLTKSPGPWVGSAEVSFSLWGRLQAGSWQMFDRVNLKIDLSIRDHQDVQRFGTQEIASALNLASGRNDLSGEIAVETRHVGGRVELAVTLVNTSVLGDGQAVDPRFYEARLSVSGIETESYLLDNLEDTFRYDRTVFAYGINGGVSRTGDTLSTENVQTATKLRPLFWGGASQTPNLSFERLSREPIAAVDELAQALRRWGALEWDEDVLERRSRDEAWSEEMLTAAKAGAVKFDEELERVEGGVRLLSLEPEIFRAFTLMNEAMQIIGARKDYSGWRPFQLGFLLANLGCLKKVGEESDTVDIVWFATGGGKTETYLGLIMAAAFCDRLTGKSDGCTAWSRFPLRLLSLQQMQRFADALAAAEIVRRRHDIPGAPFSLGFLVGDGATPNKIRRPEQDQNSRHDPDDPAMPGRYRLLQRCPFCSSTGLEMAFNTAAWTLEHRCINEECSWPDRSLPFYVVDEEVFRFLPTVVVGTLDKAALIGMQQAMRGMVGGPLGRCPTAGHGYTYNRSSKSPAGCLVPDCNVAPQNLPFDSSLFPPSFRLQDELHLLRDSLGAVDAHYEAALDGLQLELTGRKPKIVASSATLSGYEKQAAVLYRRPARVFPQPAPSQTSGFWTLPSSEKMRKFVAVAPRGATVEFAVDRLLNELQMAIRRLLSEPEAVCSEIGVDPALAPFLLDQYGTDVIYGNTLRDLEAVARSSGTQLVDVQGDVNIVSLTGRTQFEEVSETLDRLENTDSARPFQERVHIVTASSMMSHGVDIDRLNVMVVLGVPLTTAEFIQATARVGRRWPALVIVVHKMARERDAGVYRSFPKFVEQGDRLVEPIPITRRSRRVLERTLSGIEMSRLLHVHAPAAVGRFTTASAVNRALQAGSIVPVQEAQRLVSYLGYDHVAEEDHINDIGDSLDRYWERIASPQTAAHEWYGNVWGNRPMRSLRDVDEQVPVHLKR